MDRQSRRRDWPSQIGSRDGSAEESGVTGQTGGARSRRRRRDAPASEDESSKLASTSGANDLTDYDVKPHQQDKSRDENGDLKPETEDNSGNDSKATEKSSQPSEAPQQDYIHVRARRGQATDSHSLAERARREKISERMKILQDLVPGCNKIIGKALVLDEIINYIQSLQRQVEFLSMKLEAVNSRLTPGIDSLASKDFGIQAFDSSSGMGFVQAPVREYGQGSPPQWLHMQVGGFERGS